MGRIALQGVSKVFPGGVVAVDDVDMEIGDGEFMVLVGPSGCGKSTLLRMIAGLEGVSGGTISIGDRDVTEIAPRSRDIAMVFQNYALYPHMRVWDNLAFALKLRRTAKPALKERVDSVAGVLGLRDLIDRKPGALSGGQRQRVAIGRAMVREPQAYLMDEPLSNLDAKLRVGMRAELARLHERLGVTTVYVTHDQVEAMTLGDRVAVLRDGTVQQCDTPERLFDDPANVFVAAFIGSPAMNLAPGELRGGVLSVAGIEIPLATPPRHEGPVVAGVRPTDLTARRRRGAEAASRAGGRRAARLREPCDLRGRRPEARWRSGRRRRRGDRGERGDAAGRRRPRPLHRGRARPPPVLPGRGGRAVSAARGGAPVRPGDRRGAAVTIPARASGRHEPRRQVRAVGLGQLGVERLGDVDRAHERMRRERAHRVARVA